LPGFALSDLTSWALSSVVFCFFESGEPVSVIVLDGRAGD
jgi:hypothetical protein